MPSSAQNGALSDVLRWRTLDVETMKLRGHRKVDKLTTLLEVVDDGSESTDDDVWPKLGCLAEMRSVTALCRWNDRMLNRFLLPARRAKLR